MSEKTQYTPGPWERRVNITGSVIRIEGRERPDEQRRIVGYATTFSIAEIAGSQHGNDGGKAYANARLIAAAPEMASALEPFDEALGEDESDYPDDMQVVIKFGAHTGYTLTLGDFRRARAALSKATGQ